MLNSWSKGARTAYQDKGEQKCSYNKNDIGNLRFSGSEKQWKVISRRQSTDRLGRDVRREIKQIAEDVERDKFRGERSIRGIY